MSAALAPYNFTINDQSPLFQYLPYPDGPIASSWNVTYSESQDSTWVKDGAVGAGSSSHRTSLVGASIQLDWTGTAIYLYGSASAEGYTIQLDGANAPVDNSNDPGVLFTQSGIPYGPHSLLFRLVEGQASISNAVITVGLGESGSTIQNRTIATSSLQTTNGIVLEGLWIAPNSFVPGDTRVPLPHLTTQVQGASISFPLTNASAFYVVGNADYDHGTYSVKVNPPLSGTEGPFNSSSRWIGLNSMLFLGSGMNRSQTYQVVVTNTSPNRWLDVNQIVILDAVPSLSPGSGTSSSSRSLSSGATAGIVVAGVAALLILGGLLFWRHKRRHAASNHPIDDSSDHAIEQQHGPNIYSPYTYNPLEMSAASNTNIPSNQPWTRPLTRAERKAPSAPPHGPHAIAPPPYDASVI